jgi:hypothetical protein
VNAAALPETASFAGFARILGVKPQAVTALRHAGRLVLTDDGKRVQVAASQQRIRDTADPSKAGVVARHAAERAAKAVETADMHDPLETELTIAELEWNEFVKTADMPDPLETQGAGEADDDTPGSRDYQSSRARREHYQALEAQRAYEVAIGKLMDAGEVAAAVAGAAATLRTRLEGLPDILGPQLAAIHDEAQCRATLAEAIEHALEETARQFSNIAKQVSA